MNEIEQIEDGRLALMFALMLFAGIRTGEIERIAAAVIRGKHEAIFDTDRQAIFLGNEINKMGHIRWIGISPNLAVWMKRYPSKEPEHFDLGLLGRWRPVVAKKYGIPRNGLRRTFICYHAATYGIEATAREAGISVELPQPHLLRQALSKSDVEAFWAIRPRN
jgi:integrase